MSEEQVIDSTEAVQEVVETVKRVEDPTEAVFTFLGLYMPKYLAMVDRLSSKAMRRLLKKLPEFPLNEKEMKATSDLEQQTFLLATRLTEAKFVLVQHTLIEAAQKEMEKQMDNKNNEGEKNDNTSNAEEKVS